MPDFPGELLPHCWFLAGPTASGKSATALELADRLDAEIVALDSMTLYRGMDIGTAKPSSAEQATVPHHLLDLLDPAAEFSLAEYVTAATEVTRQIVSRRRVPLFVGGTGLYLRGMLRGVFEGPAADWTLRRQWEDFARIEGEPALHAELAKVDPVLAARLPPADLRRVIRGLEVFALTGQPLSAQQQQGPRPVNERPRATLWLHPPREWLNERINDRVNAMFAAGLIDEVRQLAGRPTGLGRTARQALGYREILDALDRGEPPESARELIQLRTRQFAKRQHTWFRNLEECREVAYQGSESPRELAEFCLAAARS
jgi:tRNA dimethylallyltransferase